MVEPKSARCEASDQGPENSFHKAGRNLTTSQGSKRRLTSGERIGIPPWQSKGRIWLQNPFRSPSHPMYPLGRIPSTRTNRTSPLSPTSLGKLGAVEMERPKSTGSGRNETMRSKRTDQDAS